MSDRRKTTKRRRAKTPEENAKERRRNAFKRNGGGTESKATCFPGDDLLKVVARNWQYSLDDVKAMNGLERGDMLLWELLVLLLNAMRENRAREPVRIGNVRSTS